MSLRTYKTNRLLWLALSLVIFLFYFSGIEIVFSLFSGRLRVDDLLSFEFIAPLVFSVVMGWLAQCAIVIVFHWFRRKAKK
jgi:hypothetical protein